MSILRILTASGIVAFGAIGTTTVARAVPVASLQQNAAGLGPVSEVRHRGYRHRAYRGYPRARLYVTPGGYGYPYAYRYYGGSRGFEDPGYAYHGNLSGCAVDLGYGRWESCDK